MTSSAQNSKQYLAQQGSVAVPAYSFLGDQDTGIYRSAANELSIATNATRRVVVDSSGNVGVGTGFTPTAPLHVKSNQYPQSKIAAQNGEQDAAIEIIPAGSLARNYRLIAGGGAFEIYDVTDGSTRLTITSTGNVGIGTKTPDALLTVSTIASFGDGAVTTPSIAHKGDLNTGLWFPAADTIAASTAGTERMRIVSGGFVGIGASAPNSTLSVQGAGQTTSAIVTSSSMPGTIGVSDTGATGGNGGGLVFSANSEAWKFAAIKGLITSGSGNSTGDLAFSTRASTADAALTEAMRITSAGYVGIGTTPSYQLQVNTDSAAKPGVGGLWTVVSDERIKSDIVPANLDRCYEIVKSVPLKHFGFAPGVYTDDQINDYHNLGWIAQDVQKVFKNAVSVRPFTLKTAIPDGVEEYEEQDFTLELIKKTETSIQVIDGKAVQTSKVVTSENKIMLFDTVDVLDEAGDVVMDGDKPMTYQMPRMITKTRPKVRHDVIEDCLDLNSGQMIAALYGAVQALMEKIETLTTRLAKLENAQ